MNKYAKGVVMPTLIEMFLAESFFRDRTTKDPLARTKIFAETTTKYCRRATNILDVEIQTEGYDPAFFEKENCLFVSNHLSYLDILVMSSLRPFVYVSSVDMSEVFLLGRIITYGGTIFVERRNRVKVEQDLGNMTKALNDGFNVMLFPEGTSTNGSDVLPFKKSLLMAAVHAGKRIVPVSMKYVEIDGEPFSEKNRDYVCWYGDMGFGSHFKGLCARKKVVAKVSFLDPIPTTPESTRNELAELTYSAVTKSYLGTAKSMPPSKSQQS